MVRNTVYWRATAPSLAPSEPTKMNHAQVVRSKSRAMTALVRPSAAISTAQAYPAATMTAAGTFWRAMGDVGDHPTASEHPGCNAKMDEARLDHHEARVSRQDRGTTARQKKSEVCPLSYRAEASRQPRGSGVHQT